MGDRSVWMRGGALAVLGLGVSGCVTTSPYRYDGGPGYTEQRYGEGAVPISTGGPWVSEFAANDPTSYAWIDRADALWEAVGDAPPDFGFVYGEVEPWAWTTQGGYWIITEPEGDAVRGYYYEPGQDEPFLILDVDRGYGFAQGRLVVVYDQQGNVIDGVVSADEANDAALLYLRARSLREAAVEVTQQVAVAPEAWEEATPIFFNVFYLWDEGRARNPYWHAYRRRPDVIAHGRAFAAERERRRLRAERYRQWKAGGYQGQPPKGLDRPGRRGEHRGDGRGWAGRDGKGHHPGKRDRDEDGRADAVAVANGVGTLPGGDGAPLGVGGERGPVRGRGAIARPGRIGGSAGTVAVAASGQVTPADATAPVSVNAQRRNAAAARARARRGDIDAVVERGDNGLAGRPAPSNATVSPRTDRAATPVREGSRRSAGAVQQRVQRSGANGPVAGVARVATPAPVARAPAPQRSDPAPRASAPAQRALPPSRASGGGRPRSKPD